MENNSKIGVVYGRAEYFEAREGEWKLPAFNIVSLIKNNLVYCSAIYRKKVWEDCGGSTYQTHQSP